jgi:integrase
VVIRVVVDLNVPPWLMAMQPTGSASVLPTQATMQQHGGLTPSRSPIQEGRLELNQEVLQPTFFATTLETDQPIQHTSTQDRQLPEQRILIPQVGESKPQCFSDLTPASTLCELMAVAIPQMAGLKDARTLTDRSSFIAHWIRITGDPPLREITGEHLVMFRDRLLTEPVPAKSRKMRKPLSPQTVKKHHGIFKYFMSIAVQLKLIEAVPQPTLFSKSILKPSQAGVCVKKVRDIIGREEMARIFVGCSCAVYPMRDTSRKLISDRLRLLMWRSMIAIVWTYGMRISDLERLHFGCFDFTPREHAPHGMVLFAPWKLRRKNRLQGLPLPPLIVAAIGTLRNELQSHFSVTSYDGPLFPFRWKAGSWNTPDENKSTRSKGSRSPHWIAGWRTTLQRDILATQGIVPTMGSDEFKQEISSRPDSLPGLTPHVFRQTAITEYNDRVSETGRRLGQFIAGQSGGAVDAASYDKPDKAVWQAIKERVENDLPTEWSEWFLSLSN